MAFSCKTPKCTLLFLFTLSLLALYTLHHHPLLPSPSSLTAANVFLSSASNYTVSAYLRHLTLRPHLAGTPLSLSTALYVHSHFQSLGLTAHTTNFSALFSSQENHRRGSNSNCQSQTHKNQFSQQDPHKLFPKTNFFQSIHVFFNQFSNYRRFNCYRRFSLATRNHSFTGGGSILRF